MRIVGVIEMLVGVGFLSPKVGISSYAASVWLSSIAANLAFNKDYDIAVRDIDMAISAFVLGRLSKLRAENRSEQDRFALYEEPAA